VTRLRPGRLEKYSSISGKGCIQKEIGKCKGKGKGKAVTLQAWTGPTEFQEIEASRFQDSRHIKVVRLSAVRTGRLCTPRNIPGTHFCYRLSQPQGHSATGRIMSMKNFNDTIGNRTRDPPACSAVPQPSAPTETGAHPNP
jgi:hypothetical protein